MPDLHITPFSPARVLALHTRRGASAAAVQASVQASIGALHVLQDSPGTALAFAWEDTPLQLGAVLPEPLHSVTDLSHALEGLSFSGHEAAAFLVHQLGLDFAYLPSVPGVRLRGARTLIAQVPCCALACEGEDALRLLVPRSYFGWIQQRLQAVAQLYRPH